MNTGHRPLPATMPPLARGRIMVARGEFKTLSDAMRHHSSLRSAKQSSTRASALVSTSQHSPPHGDRSTIRLPYKDE